MFFRKLSLLILTAGLSTSLWALPVPFEEGTDYDVISEQGSVSKEVLEFFSYNCPHCFSFDPTMENFLAQKPEDVRFRRVPVGFGRSTWERSADAFVLAKALGKGAALHSGIFNRVQTLNNPFKNEADVRAFFLANGVKEEEFDKALKSFTATTLSKTHESLLKKFTITSVPTVIVNGKYKVNISHELDSQRFIRLVDYLLKLDMY